jgi:hypothetical protein
MNTMRERWSGGAVERWSGGRLGGNDLDDLALGPREEARVFPEGFHVLPFPVAFEVVLVGGALVIVHELHATGAQHLHHQRGAGARQAGNEGEGGALDVRHGRVCGGFLRGLLAAEQARRMALLGAGGDAVAQRIEPFLAGQRIDQPEADEAVVAGLDVRRLAVVRPH